MQTVLVQIFDAAGEQRVVELGPGKTATFGRGSQQRPVDVPIANAGVSRLAGEIQAAEDYWLLSNFSQDKSYVVENPEGGGEYLRVGPRRVRAPIPFEFARVILPVGDQFTDFFVFAPQHTYLEASPNQEPPGADATMAAFPLDESAKYFLVLVALCEPRLRDASTVAIPSVPEVVERLQPRPDCRDLSAAAVNSHIDYLARVKLRVKEPAEDAGRLEWKREALVALALRFGLVGEEHLGLLPSRSTGSRAG